VVESYMRMCGYGMCVREVRIFIRINIHILSIRRSAHLYICTSSFYLWPLPLTASM